jgi:hypothetical protein
MAVLGFMVGLRGRAVVLAAEALDSKTRWMRFLYPAYRWSDSRIWRPRM